MDEKVRIATQADDRSVMPPPVVFETDAEADTALARFEAQRRALSQWMDLSKDVGEWE